MRIGVFDQMKVRSFQKGHKMHSCVAVEQVKLAQSLGQKTDHGQCECGENGLAKAIFMCSHFNSFRAVVGSLHDRPGGVVRKHRVARDARGNA